jgi:hypothetical protein
VTERSWFLPAQDHSVFSQVVIDLLRVEFIKNVFPIYLDIILPRDFMALELFYERPTGT